ncbi:MAG: hypothetical protein EOL97_12330 [Spirochaetia bacterium]|nr:hypothetical protein [Spirochaetia bacterium]
MPSLLKNIDKELINQLNIPIIEIRKYKVAESDENDADELKDEILNKYLQLKNEENEEMINYIKKYPNVLYNASMSISHYLKRLNEFGILEKLATKNQNGEKIYVLPEPNETLDRYLFWVHCSGKNVRDINNENKLKFGLNESYFQSFKFELEGTYIQPEKIFNVEKTKCKFEENKNKPIFSMIYESLQENKDSKQPQFYDIKTNSIIGKPFGYLLALLSKVYKIVRNEISSGVIIFSGKPLKKFNETELKQIIESFSFDEVKPELAKYAKNLGLPVLKENFDEHSIPRSFVIENVENLSKFDIYQEDHKENKVFNQNDETYVKMRLFTIDDQPTDNVYAKKTSERIEKKEENKKYINDKNNEEEIKTKAMEIINNKFINFINSIKNDKQKELLIQYLIEIVKNSYLSLPGNTKMKAMINKVDFNILYKLYPNIDIPNSLAAFQASLTQFLNLIIMIKKKLKIEDEDILKILNINEIESLLSVGHKKPLEQLENNLDEMISNKGLLQKPAISSKKEISNIKDKDREKIAKYKKEFLMKNSTLSKKLSPFK